VEEGVGWDGIDGLLDEIVDQLAWRETPTNPQ